MTIEKLKSAVDKTIKDTKSIRDEMTRFAKEYKGEWWADNDQFNKLDSKVFVNFLFSTIQATAPLLTDNRPKVDVFAREPYFQRIAEVYSKAFEYVWEKTGMDEKTYLAAKDSLLFGMAIYKVYFNPDAEGGLGEIQTDLIDPREFVIAPGYVDVWEAAWCGEKRRVPLSWVKRMYPEKAEEVKSETAKQDGDSDIDLSDRDDFDLESEFVTVYEIWIRDNETEEYIDEEKQYDGEGNEIEPKKNKKQRAKYPNGRIRTFTADNVELDDRPSPFSHGKPPYVVGYNYRMPHSFWGMGEGKQIENLVREFNLRLRQIVEHARKNTKVNWVLDGGSGITSDQAKEALIEGDHVLEAEPGFGKEAINVLDTPTVNRTSTDLLSIFPSYIEEITGVTDVTKGQISKKQRQSASEMSILLESSYTRTRQRVRNHEFALKRLGELWLELMQQYYTEVRNIRYTEDDEVVWGAVSNSANVVKELAQPSEELMEVHPDDLTDDEKQIFDDYERICEYIGNDEDVYIHLDINIQTNSTLPLDQQSKANLMLRLAEMKIVDPQAVLETINFPGAKKIIDRLKQEQEEKKKMEQQAMKMKMQGGEGRPPVPGPGEQRPQDMEDQMRKMKGALR